MTQVMIDLETLSSLPNASILTIGAVQFDLIGKLPKLDKMNTFYRRIEYKESSILHNFHVDPETMKWWKKQNVEARYEAFENPDRTPLVQALRELSEWMSNCQIVWAKSPSFDCVILENAYRICGIPVPWRYWSTRDVRTIMDLGGVSKSNNLRGEHNALNDCYQQIKEVKTSLKNLKLC